jgi:hypothetical protein
MHKLYGYVTFYQDRLGAEVLGGNTMRFGPDTEVEIMRYSDKYDRILVATMSGWYAWIDAEILVPQDIIDRNKAWAETIAAANHS